MPHLFCKPLSEKKLSPKIIDHFETQAETLHRIVADDFIMVVGDVQELQFKSKRGIPEIKIVA